VTELKDLETAVRAIVATDPRLRLYETEDGHFLLKNYIWESDLDGYWVRVMYQVGDRDCGGRAMLTLDDMKTPAGIRRFLDTFREVVHTATHHIDSATTPTGEA
jgi:hypothetical protein